MKIKIRIVEYYKSARGWIFERTGHNPVTDKFELTNIKDSKHIVKVTTEQLIKGYTKM